MILYSQDPIALGEASKVKAWLSTAEAQLFKDCVTAQMNQHYLDAINAQSKPAITYNDQVKFNSQAEDHLIKAKEILLFLKVFENFAGPDYGFHKLKINT